MRNNGKPSHLIWLDHEGLSNFLGPKFTLLFTLKFNYSNIRLSKTSKNVHFLPVAVPEICSMYVGRAIKHGIFQGLIASELDYQKKYFKNDARTDLTKKILKRTILQQKNFGEIFKKFPFKPKLLKFNNWRQISIFRTARLQARTKNIFKKRK